MPTFRGTVTIDHPSLGGTGTNTWHVRTTGSDPLDAPELGGLSSILEDLYEDLVLYLASGTVVTFDGVWTSVEAEPQINATDGEPFTFTSEASQAGLPPANAIVLGWRSSLATRSGRGRTFMGPLDSVTLGPDGTVADTQLGEIQAAADALVDASTGFANGAFVVYSPTDALARDFISVSISDQFAVLRSRRD